VRREEIAKQIQALDDQFEKAEREHDKARFPLEDRLHECNEAIRQASRARRDLLTTCDDPGLNSELEHVESEIKQLADTNRDLLSKATHFEDRADCDRDTADRETGGERHQRFAKAKELAEEAKAVRKRIKANEKLTQELQRHRTQIEEQMRQQ
jgi:hypothetical protein